MKNAYLVTMRLEDHREGESPGTVAEALRIVLETTAIRHCMDDRQCPTRIGRRGCAGHVVRRFTVDSLAVLNADDEPKFVAIHQAVMAGDRCVATATSKTFAKRIANALNQHKPTREGV